jgi:hypothetical protein
MAEVKEAVKNQLNRKSGQTASSRKAALIGVESSSDTTARGLEGVKP